MKLRWLEARHTFIGLGSLVGIILVTLPQAKAEGGGKRPTNANGVTGDHGANRRVRTLSTGYIAVRGKVDLSFEHLPVAKNATFLDEKPQLQANPKADSPSAYLGGKAFNQTTGQWAEYDAGLAYEPFYSVPDPHSNNRRYPPGFAAFISWNGIYTSPHLWQNGRATAWRGGSFPSPGKGRIISNLTFVFHSATTSWVSLYVSAIPVKHRTTPFDVTFYYNPGSTVADFGANDASEEHLIVPDRGEAVQRYTELSDASVKRVVAVTRKAPGKEVAGGPKDELWLDGIVTTCTFSSGELFKIGGPWRPWGPGDVEQLGPTNTGYDAPGGSGSDALDRVRGDTPMTGKAVGLHPRTIVEFPNMNNTIARYGDADPSAQQNASYALQEAKVSRYQHETVRINLRRYIHKSGDSKTVK